MSESQARRLHKGNNRLIGGVCSGIADYFGADPWVVRIVFIVLALVPTGVGLLLYLLLWILMPEATQQDAGLAETVRSGASSMAGDVKRIAGELSVGKPRTE